MLNQEDILVQLISTRGANLEKFRQLRQDEEALGSM